MVPVIVGLPMLVSESRQSFPQDDKSQDSPRSDQLSIQPDVEIFVCRCGHGHIG